MPTLPRKGTGRASQSLWVFMHEKGLMHAVRASLENFGHLEYADKEDGDNTRHVNIIPLYTLSNL